MTEPRDIDTYRRLFGLHGDKPAAPQNCGNSFDLPITKIGMNLGSTIIENRADDLDVQLVTFSVDADTSKSRTVSPIIQIDWGVGGTQHTAYLNVKRGMLFTVGCSFYRVTGIVERATQADIDAGAITTFRATAAYGSHPGAKEPTRETSIDVPAGGFVDIKIPPYSRMVSIYSATPLPLTNGTITALFFGDIADTDGQTLFDGSPGYELRDMSFGLDHETVRITNNGLALINVMIQFEIAF